MKQFKHKGLMFRLTTTKDEHIREPWTEFDMCGVVTNWRKQDTKAPWERILCEDKGSCRFYDQRASMKKAKQQGWGLSQERIVGLAKKLGREPAAGDILAESVEADFERMRAWCNDEWEYLTLHVELMSLTEEEPVPGYDDYLGGVESDSDAYVMESAREMADNIISAHDISDETHIVSREYAIR